MIFSISPVNENNVINRNTVLTTLNPIVSVRDLVCSGTDENLLASKKCKEHPCHCYMGVPPGGQYPAILTKQAWPKKAGIYFRITVNNGARVTGNPERAR